MRHQIIEYSETDHEKRSVVKTKAFDNPTQDEVNKWFFGVTADLKAKENYTFAPVDEKHPWFKEPEVKGVTPSEQPSKGSPVTDHSPVAKKPMLFESAPVPFAEVAMAELKKVKDAKKAASDSE